LFKLSLSAQQPCEVTGGATMVLEGLLGAAWSYAAGSYSYNLNRFQFDAGQRQSTAHQLMNLRIARWTSFREDVRDLFQLTTANLSSYMVVGTLFFSLAISIMYARVTDFPAEPFWLMVAWGNCLLSATTFAILSVWLAVHGSMAAHSASVKVLTQAVRIPVPSEEDLMNERHRLEQYEKSGVANYLQFPGPTKLMKVDELVTEVGEGTNDVSLRSPRVVAGGQCTARNSHEHGHGALGRSQSPIGSRRRSSSKSSSASSGHSATRAGAFDPERHERKAVRTQERAARLLKDQDGGTGRSAAFDGHIKLFRQVHMTFASFDAYARISLSTAVHDLMLTMAYLTFAHNICLKPPDTYSRRNVFFAWITTCVVTFVNIVLFKLDLFVENRKMRILKQATLGGPLFLCFAATFWLAQQTYEAYAGLKYLSGVMVVFACLMHLSWTVLMLVHSRPADSDMSLPIAWRSVRYLDIFGWAEDTDPMHAVSELGLHAEPDVEGVLDSTKRRACALMQTVTGMLDGKCACHLDGSSVALLESLRGSLVATVADCGGPPSEADGSSEGVVSFVSYGGLPMPEEQPQQVELQHRQRPQEQQSCHSEHLWVECEHAADPDSAKRYFLNIATGDLAWEPPAAGDVITLSSISKSVEDVRQDVLAHSRRSPVRETVRKAETSPGTSEEPVPFEPMARRPGSTHDIASMPWRYFSQVCFCHIILWSLSTIWIAYFEVAGLTGGGVATSDPAQRFDLEAEAVPHSWPHQFFRPSMVACAPETSTLFAGDGFELYASDLAGSGIPPRLRHVSFSARAPSSRSFAAFDGGRRLLLLDRSGLQLTEVAVERSRGVQIGTILRQWSISLRLGTALQAISVVSAGDRCTGNRFSGGSHEGPDSIDAEVSGGARHNATEAEVLLGPTWAVLAATERGDIVVLCPEAGRVEPAYVVAPAMAVGGSQEVLGLHWGGDGALWLFTTAPAGVMGARSGGVADGDRATKSSPTLRAWDAGGASMGQWQLPPGRRWAAGLCAALPADLRKPPTDGSGESDTHGFIVSAERLVDGSLVAYPELLQVRTDRVTLVGPRSLDAEDASPQTRTGALPQVVA